jgi:hypothetical protein
MRDDFFLRFRMILHRRKEVANLIGHGDQVLNIIVTAHILP